MRSEVPSRLNRYVLGDVIGAGGMGTVLRGRDQVLGRAVAVKLLRSELAGDGNALARFRQEARIAASLSHPGIAAVYDFLEEEDHQALVMELLDGEDLHAILAREGAMDPQAAAGIAAEVADALAYAHRLGAVHRDVKPANIVLTHAGVVKLTDFGIASAASVGQLSTTGALIGTPDYLSPEQVRGERATPASDIYSLGCVVFQLVTGRPPFTGDNAVAIATARLDVPAPSAAAVNPAVGWGLDGVIRCALAPLPEDRFVSADAMARALRAVVPSDPAATQVMGVAPRMSGRGPVTPPLGIRSGGPSTLVEMPLPGPSGVLGPPTRVLSGAPPAPVGPVRPRTRHRWGWLWAAVIVLLAVGTTADIVRSWQVANAPKLIPVSWSGASFQTVSADARRMGFQVKRADKDSQVAAGTVLSVVPTAGQRLPKGGTVTLQVSLGNLLPLPDVTSKSPDAATAILKGAGLTIIVSDQTVPSTVDNQVDSQSPPAGSLVKRGASSVTVVLTKVPPPPPAPTFGDNLLNPFLQLFGLGNQPAGNPTPAPAKHHQGSEH
ncbi:MAG: hypothetical protein NVSMB32_05530 [Actinomycetota bacterium]